MALFILFLLLQLQSSTHATFYITSRALETSVRTNLLNIESINEAFFPINKSPSIVVDVYYFVNETQDGTSTVPEHPVQAIMLNRSARHDVLTRATYLLKWVSQPILLPCPDMLKLSGFGAFFEQKTPTATIVIRPICSLKSNWCKARIEKLLVQLTNKVFL